MNTVCKCFLVFRVAFSAYTKHIIFWYLFYGMSALVAITAFYVFVVVYAAFENLDIFILMAAEAGLRLVLPEFFSGFYIMCGVAWITLNIFMNIIRIWFHIIVTHPAINICLFWIVGNLVRIITLMAIRAVISAVHGFFEFSCIYKKGDFFTVFVHCQVFILMADKTVINTFSFYFLICK